MSIKILLYDTETGGLHPVKNGIHQLALRLFVDYKLVKEAKVDCQFGPQHEYSPEALAVSGKTIEQIMASPFTQQKLYASLHKLVSSWCDPKNKQDKIFLAGFNNHGFDNEFLRSLWLAHGDKYFGSFFFSNSLDAMLMASGHLPIVMKRHLMPNFKLTTVAAEFGYPVDLSKAHDAMYDIDMTQHILQKLLGIEFTM